MGTTGWIVLGLPLLGSIILALYGSKEPPKAVTRWVGCGSIGLAFILTVDIFIRMLGDNPEQRVHVSRLWEWIEIGDLHVDLAIRIDQLSVMMMLVITGVGFLIHVYSTEYMDHEPGYRRFFAEMNFFVFSMLLLVEAANFIFLIVGWAFVGLASYLLIGFYYDRPVAVSAAKKAFVINVIGDVGMVIAAFLLARDLGTLDYTEVFASAPETLTTGSGVAVAIALLLFDDITVDAPLLVPIMLPAALQLGQRHRRNDGQCDQLGVGVVQRGAGRSAVVFEHRNVAKPHIALEVCDPITNGAQDSFESYRGQVGQGFLVVGRLDDDFMGPDPVHAVEESDPFPVEGAFDLQGWKLIRNDPNLPARAVGLAAGRPMGENFSRGQSFLARAERTEA